MIENALAAFEEIRDLSPPTQMKKANFIGLGTWQLEYLFSTAEFKEAFPRFATGADPNTPVSPQNSD